MGKTMICKLCKTDTKLCDSHIIPEFFYKYIYDEKNRVFVIPGDLTKKVDVRQKGYTENLLCNKCESQLSKYERYTKTLLSGGKLPVKMEMDFKECFIVSNINYTYFKLFLMSVLWRASIATHWFYKFVALGKHEEVIRKMISSENPGSPEQYGCLITTLESQGELLDLIRNPDQTRVDGHISYRFIMGGFIWLFIVSNHTNNFVSKEYFLQEDGRQVILKSKVSDFPFLLKEAENMKGQEDNMKLLIDRYNIDITNFM